MRTLGLLAIGLATAPGALAGPLALEASRRPEPTRAMAPAPDSTVLALTPVGAARLDPASREIVATYDLPDESFPDAIAAIGNDVLVGKTFSDNASGTTPFGVAFLLDGTTGGVRHRFTSPVPPTPNFGNQFGAAVGAAGDDVLVGDPGARAVYRFDGATGVLERTYPDPGPGTVEIRPWFGTSVLGLGDAVVVGAPADRAVHVFDAASAALRRTIIDPRTTDDLSFGAALGALDADLLVGAPGGSEAAVHRFDPATGALLGTYAKPGDPLERNAFGQTLAVGDGRVIVGDPTAGAGLVGDEIRPSLGAAHVFDGATGALLQSLPNPTPIESQFFEDERFGAALAAVPGRVLVADPFDFTNSSVANGGIYVYVDVTACGDGAPGALEACDDGNLADGDGCDANCRPTACGNGVVTAGESCDDGNRTDGDLCDSNCTPTRCGNGAVSPGEQCDDGNAADGDGCSRRCTAEVCGNGVLDPGERCDDGNATDGDACSAGCQPEPRDYFTCYRARGDRGRTRSVLLVDAFESRPALVGRPIAFCQGDALTAPLAQLTCYRLKHVQGPRRFPRRGVSVADAAGETLLVTTQARTLCLPSTGSRLFRLAHTFTDPLPPPTSDFGLAITAVDGKVIVGSPDESAGFRDGLAFVFDASTGSHGATLCCGRRDFGASVAPAGGGQVLVSTIDDESYLHEAATGLRLRTFVGPGQRTPNDVRPIAAVGPYVLSGDPTNHDSGFSFGGAVHVFDRATGARLRTLFAPAPALFRAFGGAVAALGTQALIADSQRVYLYDTTTWTPLREFAVSTLGAESVAAAGRRVLIGSPASNAPGEATLLDADTGDVIRVLHDDLAAPEDGFGTDVDSTAGAFVVGAPASAHLAPDGGAVHVFDAASGARLHTLVSPDAGIPGFGRRVAGLGDDLIVSSVPPNPPGPFSPVGVVHYFRGALDAFKCYDARPSSAGAGFAPRERWIADTQVAGPVRLDRPVALCNPAARDGGALVQPDLALACYAVADRRAPARRVTVANALGTETLTVSGRRFVCLAGAHGPPQAP